MKDQVLRKLFVVAPDDPPHSRIYQAVLVARDVDRLDQRQPEIPLEVGVEEGRDEPAACGVDVERHLPPLPRIELDEGLVAPRDRLELAGVSRPQGGDGPDRVRIGGLHDLLGGDHVAAVLDRQVSGLHVPVPAELLPHHLNVRAHDQVGPVGRLASDSSRGADDLVVP